MTRPISSPSSRPAAQCHKAAEGQQRECPGFRNERKHDVVDVPPVPVVAVVTPNVNAIDLRHGGRIHLAGADTNAVDLEADPVLGDDHLEIGRPAIADVVPVDRVVAFRAAQSDQSSVVVEPV